MSNQNKIRIAKTVGLIVLLVSLIAGLKLMDEHEKNKAIERCGGKDKIVTRYTKEGDAYYTCVEEK